MKKVIDLTYEVHGEMPKFGAYWHPEVEIKKLGDIETEGRRTHEIKLGTHTGTHIDAPAHFISGGETIEAVPLDRLIGDLNIIDFSHMANDEQVTVDLLKEIELNKRVLFKFGWGKNWGDSDFYQGYPYFSRKAAKFIVDKNVQLLAMDTPSPDKGGEGLSEENRGNKKDSPIHKYFLSNGVILVEYIANLDEVENFKGWKIAAMPLKICGGDGAPARVCIFK